MKTIGTRLPGATVSSGVEHVAVSGTCRMGDIDRPCRPHTPSSSKIHFS